MKRTSKYAARVRSYMMMVTVILASQMATFPSESKAVAIIYEYSGNPLSSATDPSFFDAITGWVEFGAPPTPGATGVSNVVAFSFQVGSLTITDAMADFTRFEFDFDLSSPTPNITAWDVFARDIDSPVPGIYDVGAAFVLGNIDIDFTFLYLSDGSTISANNFDPGEWTYVPLPAAVWLFGSGLLGLVGMARHKKA